MTDMNEDKLLSAARRLETGVAPQRDLWPEIAAAIAEPDRTWWTPLLAQAAAVVLLVAASSSITYLVVTDQQQPVTRVAPELLFEQTAFGGYNLGPGFQDARSELASELDVELKRLSPESRAEIESNLEIIQAAIFEINQALEKEPDNTLLQQQLLNAYNEELTLLRRVGGLTRNIMARNDI
jgi:hypothetical protein